MRPSGIAKTSHAHQGMHTHRRRRAGPQQPIPPDPLRPRAALPLTLTTISDPKLLQPAHQGRALDTPLGWYRLQEGWTALTVKALQDLTTPGKDLHDTIVDLVL